MINDDFYNIAREMLAVVSAGMGVERKINKGFWKNNGVFRVADKKICYPSSVEIRAAFKALIQNRVVEFRDYGDDLGITMLTDDNRPFSTFSFALKPNVG